MGTITNLQNIYYKRSGETYGLLQADGQIHHRDVGGGDTESHTGQFAVRTRRSRVRRKLKTSQHVKWNQVRVDRTRSARGRPCPRPWRLRWRRGWCSGRRHVRPSTAYQRDHQRSSVWRWRRGLCSGGARAEGRVKKTDSCFMNEIVDDILSIRKSTQPSTSCFWLFTGADLRI